MDDDFHRGYSPFQPLQINFSVEDYTGLGWSRCVSSSVDRGTAAGYMSVLSSGAECGSGVYLEVSSVGSGARIGDHSILSFVDIGDETIPSNVVLHALKQRDGKFVARIYGVGDNPKIGSDGTFLGSTLEEFMGRNRLSESELWDTEEHTLWTAWLYPVCGNIREAVKAALNVYAMSRGQGDTAAWKAGARASLKSGFFDADPDALIAWEKRMGELVKMDMLAKLIFAGRPVSEAQGLLTDGKLTPIQGEWMESHLSAAEYGDRMRLNYYVGKALGGAEGERYISRCFREIQKSVLEPGAGQWKRKTDSRIVQEECTVKLPLRLNWGGGWSDTPPYCCEKVGTVLNAAVLLNGQMPVTVRLAKLNESKVVLSSADMGVYRRFCAPAFGTLGAVQENRCREQQYPD